MKLALLLGCVATLIVATTQTPAEPHPLAKANPTKTFALLKSRVQGAIKTIERYLASGAAAEENHDAILKVLEALKAASQVQSPEELTGTLDIDWEKIYPLLPEWLCDILDVVRYYTAFFDCLLRTIPPSFCTCCLKPPIDWAY